MSFWKADGYARDAVAIATAYDVWLLIPVSIGALVEILVERGELVEAEQVLEEHDLEGERLGHSPFTTPFLSRARLRIAQRRARAGLEDALECGRREVALVGSNTARHPWRSTAALAHLVLDERAQAEAVQRALALAREFGAPRQLGMALRAAGLVQAGRSGIDLLAESVAVLEESPARLELARSLADLGTALRRARRRSDSREHLRRAMEIAHQCGATALGEHARQELLATGARPRRVELSGVNSLTASERRVASMAAEGMTNNEIAQAQFVSARTIETHLGHVFRKLDIGSRKDLARVLAASTERKARG